MISQVVHRLELDLEFGHPSQYLEVRLVMVLRLKGPCFYSTIAPLAAAVLKVV